MTIKIGSLFAGIGGFELGLERSIPNSETIWQVEQDKFCQKVLAKHWPNAKIYNDVREIKKDNVEYVDILCGGFPCQDISIAGKGEGIHDGKKSSFWWEMHRIISEIRPRVAVLENVSAITFRGGLAVIGSLAQIGYDAAWIIISARDFGAPHRRDRWFCVAYPNSKRCEKEDRESIQSKFERQGIWSMPISTTNNRSTTYTTGRGYWKTSHPEPLICRVDDGFSNRLDSPRIKALGNAIVPQCSEWIGKKIWESGIL
jgi:DNA (cytosine-5)-methyltransferase 1